MVVKDKIEFTILSQTLDSLKKGKKQFLTSSFLILPGFALTVEGFDLMDGSGLLFGQYVCFGGSACGSTYETVRAIFWGGLSLLLVGASLVVLGSVLLLRIRRRMSKTFGTKILSGNQRVSFALSTIVILFLIVFFLPPIIPFQKSYDAQLPDSFPRIDVCYQLTSEVITPVWTYRGFASPAYLLFNWGNFVYSNCTVTSA